MTQLAILAAQVAALLAVAPLSVGLIRRMKAIFQNRRGASPFQPYWTLAALMRKEMTISRHASWVFHAVPAAVLASSLLLAVLLPTFAVSSAAGNSANFFVIAAVMLIGSIALVLGGMDVASAFGGMGSSREMTISAMVEPSVLLIFSGVGAVAGSWNAPEAIRALAGAPWALSHPFLILAYAAFGLVILAEAARYPVDNPSTHLELTMVHEAMVLEYSGPYLAMLEYASAIKFTVLAVFLANLLFPATAFGSGAGIFAALGWFALKIVVACLAVALTESTVAKMRFYRLQEFAATAYVLAFLGVALTMMF